MIYGSARPALHKVVSHDHRVSTAAPGQQDAAASKSMHQFITEIETHITTCQARVERIGKNMEFELPLEKTP